MSSASPSIPATVEIRRGRFIGLVAAVAALAAVVTGLAVAFAYDNGGSTSGSSRVVSAEVTGNPLPVLPHATVVAGPSAASVVGSYLPTPQDLTQVGGGGYTIGGGETLDKGPSIMSLTAADLAANGLGTGYALPSSQNGPSVDSVLASMSPQTREYTKRIMSLTFAQLAAGAAGMP
jgi:hypothetical protein